VNAVPALFWDIDGTLILTGRAGVLAWTESASEEAGRPVDLGVLETAGLTDHQIAWRIAAAVEGLSRDEATATRLVRRYEARLPECLPKRTGRVLDNVQEILEHLARARPDVRSYLLTGNTRDGGHAKLRHYDLLSFFPDGAFSRDFGDRASIARRALDLEGVAGASPDQRFVIGDTPRDILCGDAIGVRTIAVATGDYSVEQLREHSPWRAIERLPAPERFVALIGATEPSGRSRRSRGA